MTEPMWSPPALPEPAGRVVVRDHRHRANRAPRPRNGAGARVQLFVYDGRRAITSPEWTVEPMMASVSR
jgi:hypothetical protein